MAFLAWLILFLCLIVGLIGILVPVLPGIFLILFGVLVHKLLLPEYLNWWTVGVVILGVGVTFALDLMGSLVGAKWGGASKQGLWGLFLGGVVGLFFAPAGIILGPILGVFLGEVLVASRTIREGTRAGIGATLGVALSTFLKFLLGLFLLGWVLCDLWFF